MNDWTSLDCQLAIGQVLSQPQCKSYNSGWRNHPNFDYGHHQVPPPFQARQQVAPQNSGMPLEEIVKMLTISSLQFQQETRASIKNLENQISQLTASVNKLEAQGFAKLPSQTIVDPKASASVIHLQSCKEVDIPDETPQEGTMKEESEKEILAPIKEPIPPLEVNPIPLIFPCIVKLPFPSGFDKSKKEEQEEEFVQVFSEVGVNMSFPDEIQQVPQHARYVKKLCKSRKKLKDDYENIFYAKGEG